MRSIAAIIPTRNEEIHIERCIKSIDFTSDIFVLDSESSDKTCDIAIQNGCSVISFPKSTIFSHKLNTALSQLRTFDLVIRVDADEIVSSGLSTLITNLLSSSEPLLAAYSVSRKLCFLDRPMRWGGTHTYPLRIVGPKYASYQTTLIDEHVDLHGFLGGTLNGDIYDKPLHGYSHWLTKHIAYSENEVKSVQSPNLFRRKPLPTRIYYLAPPLIRPFILFIYRYFFLLGVLDGKAGLFYHISQTFLYRLIVDVRILSDL